MSAFSPRIGGDILWVAAQQSQPIMRKQPRGTNMNLKIHQIVRNAVGMALIIFLLAPFVSLPLLSFATALGQLPSGFPSAGILTTAVTAAFSASLGLFPYAYYAGWVNDMSEAAMKQDERLQ